MSAPSASMPALPAAPKPRPYRRYLTSALHTRFVHAVLLALLNSFFIAFWTGKDYFWSWFPFGSAGLKAVLFTMSSLFVFVLQLATMSVGRPTSKSPFTAIRMALFNTSTYQTLFWYTVSAWWFCEAYIWAVPENHGMSWVVRGGPNSLDRLNERPIYLRFFFSILALIQSGLHLYYGQSYLHIPIAGVSATQTADQKTHPMDSIQKQLQKRLPMIAVRSGLASGLATVTAPFIYKAFFRNWFWRVHLAFAKPFFNLPRSDANPPQTYFIGTILGWAFVVGVALSLTWELSAHSFLINLKQEPLKNGLPLSAGSKDPNGTLLNGLTAKRSVVKTFAFWELALIAQKFPDRRKAIFADFERPSGPMWTSMLRAALSVVSDMDSRILGLTSPPQPAQSQEAPEINSLPRITKDASKNKILAAPPKDTRLMQKVGNLALEGVQSLGQSTNAWSPPIKETQQKLLEYAETSIAPGGNNLQKSLTDKFRLSFLNNFFVTSPSKKITSTVLGTPIGNAAIIVDAIEAATKMLVASLNEDNFGKAVQTVPVTVKQFTKSVITIENFVGAETKSLGVDDEKELEEVVVIVGRLKAGLRELLGAFQLFLCDAGLSIRDLNEARRTSEERPLIPRPTPTESTARRPEMEEPRAQQERQLGSRNGSDRQDDARDRRARETAQSLRRMEAQPRRQIAADNGTNVFGARDFNAFAHRRPREVGTVR